MAVAGQPCSRTPPLSPFQPPPQESCCQPAAHGITAATPPHRTPHVSDCSEILITQALEQNHKTFIYLFIAAKGALAIFLLPKPCDLLFVSVHDGRADG